MVGYRKGVVQAQKDVDHFEQRGGVDARHDMIVCPDNIKAFPGMCEGYRDGYADRAMDKLE